MIANLLSVNTILVTVFGYPLSYVEFVGTVFYAYSVYLATKNKILMWPTSIVGVILFGILFYQIQLYSDLLEQVYYLITGFWGWYVWLHPKNKKEEDEKKELKVSKSSKKAVAIYLASIAVGTALLTTFISNLHTIFPQVFSVPASFPFLDAVTTVMSFAGTILLVKRKIENWYLWILVDIIGVGLYYTKEVVFLSLLYFVFLIMATKGYFSWRKILASYKEVDDE